MKQEEWWETAVRKLKEEDEREAKRIGRLQEHAYLLSGAIRHIEAMLHWQARELEWAVVWENAEAFLKDLKDNGLIND